MSPLDVALFATVAVVSVLLAALGFCPADWLWALACVLVSAFWARAVRRASRPAGNSCCRNRR